MFSQSLAPLLSRVSSLLTVTMCPCCFWDKMIRMLLTLYEVVHLSLASLSRKLSLACCTDIWQPFHLNMSSKCLQVKLEDRYSLFPMAEIHRDRLPESHWRSIKAKVWATFPSISFLFFISILETFPNLKYTFEEHSAFNLKHSHLENFFSRSSSVTSLNKLPTNNLLFPSVDIVIWKQHSLLIIKNYLRSCERFYWWLLLLFCFPRRMDPNSWNWWTALFLFSGTIIEYNFRPFKRLDRRFLFLLRFPGRMNGRRTSTSTWLCISFTWPDSFLLKFREGV